MESIIIRRHLQVIVCGWMDARIISSYKDVDKSRIYIFLDILSCFRRYYVFSNQYRSQGLWTLPKEEKESVSIKIGKENKRRDYWLKDYYRNWKFLKKWTDIKWETSPIRNKRRRKAYTKEFNAGKGLGVQHDVHIHREHFFEWYNKDWQ